MPVRVTCEKEFVDSASQNEGSGSNTTRHDYWLTGPNVQKSPQAKPPNLNSAGLSPGDHERQFQHEGSTTLISGGFVVFLDASDVEEGDVVQGRNPPPLNSTLSLVV